MKVENSLVEIEEGVGLYYVIAKAHDGLTRRALTLTRVGFHALVSAIDEWKRSDSIWNASAAAPERGRLIAPYIVHLHNYELDELIAWHRDKQYACAEHEAYVVAADHKRRREELEKMKGGGK